MGLDHHEKCNCLGYSFIFKSNIYINESKCISHMHGSRNFRQEGGVAVFDEEVCMEFHVW